MKRARRDPDPGKTRRISVPTLVTALVFGLMLAVWVAGCGSGGGTSGTTGASSGGAGSTAGAGSGESNTTGVSGAAVTIAMKDIQFVPTDVTIKAGQTVAWVNDESVQHDVVETNGLFKSPLLTKGQSFTFTFKDPGSYPFYCSIHPQMKGTVTVQP
jgi:plastocyanin